MPRTHLSRRRTALVSAILFGVACTPTTQSAAFNWVEATIEGVQAAIRSGEQTCTGITQGYLDRIEAYDKPTGLNAVIFTNPRALERARALDAALERGEPMGTLFCAPVLLKDNFDTADMPTSGGSIALVDSVPPDDAFVVARLREAGAIVIAKTNMAEWAFSPRQTRSSSYGVTANAYALDRVPAGSSGGTASGIAASFGVIGMGTDTGNSIRGPSSHLALFGIRSTLGLVSRDGIIPLAFDRDVAGPMTRAVTDAAKVLGVIAGEDPSDPYTALARGQVQSDYTQFLDPEALKGLRLGSLTALVETEDADPEINALYRQALEDLAAAGATIVEDFAVPGLAEHMEASNFCVRFRYDMHEYLRTLGETAPISDVMEVRETGQFSPYIEQRLDFFGAGPADVHPADLDPPCPDFPDHPGRQAFRRDVVEAMDEAEVDLILYPTWLNPPAHLDRAIEEYAGDNSQLVSPATGLPAASVPMGFSYDRLPAGLQILGRPFSEGLIISAAYAYEQRTARRQPQAGFPPLPAEASAR